MKLTSKIELAILNKALAEAKTSPLPESVIVEAMESNARSMLEDGRSEDFVLNSIHQSGVHTLSIPPAVPNPPVVKCPDCGAELGIVLKFIKHHS